jgi:DNA-binding SARP family transcriptional activator/tetratricopeptide (TPR) repeat protein
VAVEFRLLGGIEVLLDGRRIDVGPVRQQCVLATLLIEPNAKVSVDRIVDRVWADHAPRHPRGTLYSYINRLRRVLTIDGQVGIVQRAEGYLLEVDERAVDLHRFRDLVKRARTATDPVDPLAEALRLWRGDAFAGLDTPWLDDVRSTLELERLAVVLDYADRQLALGRHADVLARLATEAERRPLDERLAEQLILALYRSGRQADALRHYDIVRSRLADELGVDPRPALRELHQRILTTDPIVAGPAVAGPKPERQPTVPRQLPAAPWPFTGRTYELDDITSAVASRRGVVVCTIGGAGGVGKTWLALHWAHQHADDFPDGQLYVNLRGADPAGASAVRAVLAALGVAPSTLPAGLDAQVGLYRSLLVGKRLLLVLDNAADTGQVVPLLPGSASCVALITSRDRLTGLVCAHGAHPIWLDVLTEPDAHDLLAARLAAGRLAAEPEATAELVRCCAGLPLALSIVAGRALTHPEFPLAVLADELRDATTRLGVLDEDPTAGVRTVLSWSTAPLTPTESKVFGLLGLTPGPDIDAPATAALTGLRTDQADTVLRVLERVSLLQQYVPGRYRTHDLIRLYAAERATAEQPEPDRNAALTRMIDYYVHTALLASRLLSPHRPPLEVDRPPHCAPRDLADLTAALAWFEAEHAGLIATQDLAVRLGHHRSAWLLAWALVPYHRSRGCLHDDVDVWRTALTAADHLDEHARAYAHRNLGSALSRTGEYAAALAQLQEALLLAEETEDIVTQGHTRYLLAVTWGRLGDDRTALEQATKGLHLFEAVDIPVSRAQALNQVGLISARLGNYDQARERCAQALELCADHDDRAGEADTLDSLGYIAHQTGAHDMAVEYYQRAIKRYQDLGDEYSAANSMDRLGSTYAALGDGERARARWQEALSRYEAHSRTKDANRVTVRLASLNEPSAMG